MKLYVACDPSITAWGFALLGVEKGVFTSCVRTAKDPAKKHQYVADQDAERAREIFTKLYQGIKPFKMTGDTIYLISEAPAGSQNSRASKLLGICLGLLIGLESYVSEPLIFLTAGEVRKSLCGVKNASKAEVAEAAHEYLTGEGFKTDYPFTKSRLSKRDSSKAEVEARGDALGVMAAALKLGRVKF